MYNLSVVSIIDDIHKDNINIIASLYGCGDNNTSVKLQDNEGVIYWGCHSFWHPEDYATFSNEELRALVIPVELRPSLSFLYERLVLDGNAQENWQTVLSELGLSLVQEE